MIRIYWISFKHFRFCAEVIIFLSAQSLGSPGEYFMIDCSLIVRYFRGFALPVLEYRSAVWCSAADTYHKLFDRVVSGAYFLMVVCLSVTLHIVDLWHIIEYIYTGTNNAHTTLLQPFRTKQAIGMILLVLTTMLHTVSNETGGKSNRNIEHTTIDFASVSNKQGEKKIAENYAYRKENEIDWFAVFLSIACWRVNWQQCIYLITQ